MRSIFAAVFSVIFLSTCTPCPAADLGWGKGLDCSNLQLAVWLAADMKKNGVPEKTTQQMLQQHGSGKSQVLNKLMGTAIHGAYVTNDVDEYSRDIYLNCVHANFSKGEKHGTGKSHQ